MLAAPTPSLVIFGTPAENNTAPPGDKAVVEDWPLRLCCVGAWGDRRYGAPVLEWPLARRVVASSHSDAEIPVSRPVKAPRAG